MRRSYSALIDAFEDTQLVIDVYNDAKMNVSDDDVIEAKLPESDPYAAQLFPQESTTQQYQQFPKVIDCERLKQSACKSLVLQELSSVHEDGGGELQMNPNAVESVHDLIFITDYFTPGKTNFKTVTSMLDKLHIFWFQGPKDGRVYVTRDAILWRCEEKMMRSDYLTKVDENKRVWGFKKLVIARTKMIPLLLLLVWV